jgi:hypothetical protein
MDNGGNIFKKLFQLLKTAKRPPPQSGDGLYNSEDDVSRSALLKSGIIKDIKGSGASIPNDLNALLEVVKVANSGGLNVSLRDVLLFHFPRVLTLDRGIDQSNPRSSTWRQSSRIGYFNCPTRLEFASSPAVVVSWK